MPSQLDGFVKVPKAPQKRNRRSTPSVAISSKLQISLTKAAVEMFGYEPKHAEMFFNPSTQEILIQGVDEATADSYPLYIHTAHGAGTIPTSPTFFEEIGKADEVAETRYMPQPFGGNGIMFSLAKPLESKR